MDEKEFAQRSEELRVYNVTEFYNSDKFTRNGFTYDKANGQIIKQLDVE